LSFTAKAEAYKAETNELEDLVTQFRQTPHPDEKKHPTPGYRHPSTCSPIGWFATVELWIVYFRSYYS
jgi:hypothetical protein